MDVATSMPANRGSRWVPPAPGIMPSLISGSASRVSFVAMRKWQAEREFKPAAHRSAEQRRHHRFVDRFDGADHISSRRVLGDLAEFRDVGSGDERTTGASENHAGESRVVLHAAERINQSRAHRVILGIDRWVVNDNDSNIAITAGFNDRQDVTLPLESTKLKDGVPLTPEGRPSSV